jgi:hypothetical protein
MWQHAMQWRGFHMEKVGDFPREAILLTRASEAQAAALEQKARDARAETIKVHVKSPQMRLTLDDCFCFVFALLSKLQTRWLHV